MGCHLEGRRRGHQGTYQSKLAITDQQEPTGYILHVEGRGRPGWVKGNARITLSLEGPGTRLAVDAEGQVGGMVASVGQRMPGGVAKLLMNQFFECMRQRAKQPVAP